MNHARVAALLRELADELERDQVPSSASTRPPRRSKQVAPSLPEPDDVTKARARARLRRNGIALE